MGQFDGGALAVDADTADLVGAEDAVDDGGQGSALEADEGRRDVLGLHVVDQSPGHGPDLAPRAEQIEHQVHLVDAVAHRGPAALGLPAAAPGHGVVGGVPVPGGLAVRDERAPEALLGDQLPYVPRTRSEAVLEDDRGVRPPGLRAFLRLDGVEVGQRRDRRLLAPHPGAGPQRGDRLVAVQGRRGADTDQVGPLLRQHPVQIGVAVRDAVLRAELRHRVGVDVDGRDDLGLALFGEPRERGQVRAAADGADADDRGTDTAAGERGGGTGRQVVRSRARVVAGCGHGRDQHSIERDVGRWPTPGGGGSGGTATLATASAFLASNVCADIVTGQHHGSGRSTPRNVHAPPARRTPFTRPPPGPAKPL